MMSYTDKPQPNQSAPNFSQQQFKQDAQQSSKSMIDKISEGFNGKDPLDPLPEQFKRSVGHIDASPFPPLTLVSKKNTLGEGFPHLAPAAAVPLLSHPFISHDIQEDDWQRFLENIMTVAKLTGRERVRAHLITHSMDLMFPMNIIVKKGIQKKMKAKKSGPVADLIEIWNHHFFRPRHIFVILTQGTRTLTGPDDGHSAGVKSALSSYGIQPDYYRQDHQTPSDGSSDSSSESDNSHELRGEQLSWAQKRRVERRARRQARRTKFQERRAERKEKLKAGKENYQLVLVPC